MLLRGSNKYTVSNCYLATVASCLYQQYSTLEHTMLMHIMLSILCSNLEHMIPYMFTLYYTLYTVLTMKGKGQYRVLYHTVQYCIVVQLGLFYQFHYCRRLLLDSHDYGLTHGPKRIAEVQCMIHKNNNR